MVGWSAIGQVKRIAILETIDKEGKVPYAIEVMVRSNLTKVISNTPGYEGYDRVNISEIMDEHDFERTGLVNEEQIRHLGEISGADFILVSEAVKFDESNVFITAKILNVESAKTESSENALMGMTAQDIQHGCESLANRLLGIPDPYQDKKKPSQVNPITEKQDASKPSMNTTTLEPVTSNSNLGELIEFPDGSRGVVFYLDEGGNGLAVSLNEGEECWQKGRRGSDIEGLLNSQDGDTLIAYGAGFNNTETIVNALGDDGRAAYWCKLQGDGWYLPSCGELFTMVKAFRNEIMAVVQLKKAGGGEISGWYWSSSEKDNKEAWNVSSGGWVSAEHKKSNVKVRAVRAFKH